MLASSALRQSATDPPVAAEVKLEVVFGVVFFVVVFLLGVVFLLEVVFLLVDTLVGVL
jgi:hypothetical protein